MQVDFPSQEPDHPGEQPLHAEPVLSQEWRCYCRQLCLELLKGSSERNFKSLQNSLEREPELVNSSVKILLKAVIFNRVYVHLCVGICT